MRLVCSGRVTSSVSLTPMRSLISLSISSGTLCARGLRSLVKSHCCARDAPCKSDLGGILTTLGVILTTLGVFEDVCVISDVSVNQGRVCW